MSKKLYIYSILLAVVYIVFLGHSLYEMADSMIGGVKLGMKEVANGNISKISGWEVFGTYTIPVDGTASFPSVVMNEKTGETMRLEVRQALLFLTKSPDSIPAYVSILKIMLVLLSVILFAIFIYLPFVVYKIMRSISKDSFYSLKNINNLRIVSIILLSIFILNLLYNIFGNIIAGAYVQLQGYRFSLQEYSYPLLFLGLIMLILSEILRYTTTMKEESDLTI